MAGALSSTGTWTVLTSDLTPVLEQNITPRMETVKLNGTDLDSPLMDEIDQFIKLMSAGLAQAQLGGTTARLGYWATVILLRDMLTGAIAAGVPNPH